MNYSTKINNERKLIKATRPSKNDMSSALFGEEDYGASNGADE